MHTRLFPILLLAALPACSGGGTDVPKPANLTVVSGQAQSGIYGQALAQPLVVSVTDASGAPVANAAVLWSATNGTLGASSTLTDATGQASNTWTLGSNVVQQTAAAAVDGVPPVVFTATGRPDVPLVVHSCETNTATLCADFHWETDHYEADWPQGSHGVIVVNHFAADSVLLTRDDPSGTSAGIHAVYHGQPVGNSILNGIVTWTDNGQTFSGSWQASW